MASHPPHPMPDRHGAPIVLRTATQDDAEAILQHVAACDLESPFLSREPGELDATPDEERHLIRRYAETPNALFLLAEADGRLVATLSFKSWHWKRMRHTGRLGMSVRKSHWSRGIGGLMLDALIAWARENGLTRKLSLEVQEGNTRAIALYRSRGFVEEGRLQRELRIDGQWVDVIVMGLWLDDD